jgi:enamine deaminase RidA (YjgF/YER057c/UK114 family)
MFDPPYSRCGLMWNAGDRSAGQVRAPFSFMSRCMGLCFRALMICVGGQNGVGADGKVVRPTVGEQARQALRTLAAVLESEGASLASIVHWSIAVVDGHALDEGFAAFQQAWNPAGPPPASTVHVVGGLGPGFLVEIDAIAVV